MMGYFIKWRSLIRNTVQRKNIQISAGEKERLGILVDSADAVIDLLEERSEDMDGWRGIFLKTFADTSHSWLKTARGDLF